MIIPWDWEVLEELVMTVGTDFWDFDLLLDSPLELLLLLDDFVSRDLLLNVIEGEIRIGVLIVLLFGGNVFLPFEFNREFVTLKFVGVLLVLTELMKLGVKALFIDGEKDLVIIGLEFKLLHTVLLPNLL